MATAALGSTLGIDNESRLATRSWALFGQGDYDLSDQWSVTGGIRYTDETKDLLISNDFQAPAFTDSENLATNKVTFRMGLSWRPQADTMLYASLATGFKSGAFKTTFATPGQAKPAAEEQLTNYELGLKSTLLGERMRLNAAFFYSDYEDFQVQTVTTINGVPGSILANAGDVDIVGMELEVRDRRNGRSGTVGGSRLAGRPRWSPTIPCSTKKNPASRPGFPSMRLLAIRFLSICSVGT